MNKIWAYTYEKLIDKENFRSIKWSELGVCLIGFMIGRIYIFGQWNALSVAYVAACYQTKNLQRWSGLFTILGILSITQPMSLSIQSIATILLILLVRWYMETMNLKAGLVGQALIASLSKFTISIIVVAVNGFTLYDFTYILLEISFIFAFVFLYDKAIEVLLDNSKTPLTHQQAIAITVLIVSMIGGMVELYIEFSNGGRIYLRDIMCFFIIIITSYLGEASTGTAMGTIIGTLLVMIGYIPPHLISIYSLAGLGGGLLLPIGKIGCALGVLLGHMMGIYFINDGILDSSLLGAYFVAAILFLLSPKHFFGFSHWFGDKEKEYEQEIHMSRIKKLTTVKLDNFANAFKKLSTIFSNLAIKKTTFTQNDISHLFEDVTDKVCAQCGLFDYCWNKDFYNTYQAAYGILAAAEHKDKITSSDVPAAFKEKCMKLGNFVITLNNTFEIYKRDLMWHNQIVESRELISGQLQSVASIIQRLSDEIEEQVVFKRDIERRVKEELAAKGIKIQDVLIILNSNKKYEITIITNKKIEDKEEKIIINNLNTVIGRKFKVEQQLYLEDGKEYTLKIKEAHTYGIVAGAVSIAKEDSISGDQYSMIEILDGQYLLALSDGMGSGKQANNESRATIELLEEFIKSGFDKETAIKMINSILILKSSEESFSTMDMTIVDLYSGVTEFVKIGAATTFIKRKDYVELIGSTSLPVGILNKVDIETQKKQLKDGDMIIMVTDGILDADKNQLNREDTFKQFIGEINSNNPQYMAETLLEKAQNLICGEIKDDMTIIVARIWERPYKN